MRWTEHFSFAFFGFQLSMFVRCSPHTTVQTASHKVARSVNQHRLTRLACPKTCARPNPTFYGFADVTASHNCALSLPLSAPDAAAAAPARPPAACTVRSQTPANTQPALSTPKYKRLLLPRGLSLIMKELSQPDTATSRVDTRWAVRPAIGYIHSSFR